MEITIIKSETVGSGPNAAKETDPVAKFEIMDGAPVRGKRFCFSSELFSTFRPSGLSLSLFLFCFIIFIYHVLLVVTIETCKLKRVSMGQCIVPVLNRTICI